MNITKKWPRKRAARWKEKHEEAHEAEAWDSRAGLAAGKKSNGRRLRLHREGMIRSENLESKTEESTLC